MTDLILRARDLAVVYPTASTPRTALTGFNLDIHAGEIVGLLGESGSGKSSAALAMLGLTRHPGRVTGTVEFLGQDLLRADEATLRRIRGKDIALITQKPRQSLDPLITVGGQIVRAYRSHVQVSKADALVHARQLLENVGINDAARRIKAYPHELSGGMAQRALISVAMSAHPRLLVADEPTSGLDVTIQAQFLDRMWESARTDGTAVLLVTQDLGIVANYCDRVVVVDQGCLLEDRPTAEFFANPRDAYSRRVLTLTALAREHAPAATAGDMLEAGSDQRPGPGLSPREAHSTLLEVRGLDKAFTLDHRTRLQAVSDVDLTLRRGRSLGLVGESGSGKTTVGRLVLRLLEADRGSITFDGQDIGSLSARRFRSFRSRMQVVFQDPFDALNPRWTVGRVIEEPLTLHADLDSTGRRRRVEELLALVGIGNELIDHRAKGLSAGQQQRVCVARALATGPDFLVLDEPTSALPLTARAELVTLLQDLQRQLGLSFIFISHDLSTVRQLCQDVAVMYLSQIVEQGSVDEVFSNPQHPYTRALLSAVLYPDPGNRRVDRLDDARTRELKGEIPSPVNLPRGCYLASRCPLAEDRCRAEPQRLHPVDGGRLVRCWKADQEPDLFLAAEEASR